MSKDPSLLTHIRMKTIQSNNTNEQKLYCLTACPPGKIVWAIVDSAIGRADEVVPLTTAHDSSTELATTLYKEAKDVHKFVLLLKWLKLMFPNKQGTVQFALSSLAHNKDHDDSKKFFSGICSIFPKVRFGLPDYLAETAKSSKGEDFLNQEQFAKAAKAAAARKVELPSSKAPPRNPWWEKYSDEDQQRIKDMALDEKHAAYVFQPVPGPAVRHGLPPEILRFFV